MGSNSFPEVLCKAGKTNPVLTFDFSNGKVKKTHLPRDTKGKKAGEQWLLCHLEDVGDDVPLTLLQEPVLVEGGIHLEDLCQHLGHFRLGEQPPWKKQEKTAQWGAGTATSTLGQSSAYTAGAGKVIQPWGYTRD